MAKLSDTAFVILFCLGQVQGQSLHGYALLQHAQVHNGTTLRTGALYPQLTQLAQHGLIEETPGRQDEDARRRHYRITPLGMRVCAEQVRERSLLARRIMEWQEGSP